MKIGEKWKIYKRIKEKKTSRKKPVSKMKQSLMVLAEDQKLQKKINKLKS